MELVRFRHPIAAVNEIARSTGLRGGALLARLHG
jgi:hypothetical protein